MFNEQQRSIHQQALDFLGSTEFAHFIQKYPDAWKKAVQRTRVYHPDFRGAAETHWGTVGMLYQNLWEALPDRPDIRQPAFFAICGFAEEWCFGPNDDGKPQFSSEPMPDSEGGEI